MGHLNIEILPFSWHQRNETKLTSLPQDNCHPQTWTHCKHYCGDKYPDDKKTTSGYNLSHIQPWDFPLLYKHFAFHSNGPQTVFCRFSVIKILLMVIIMTGGVSMLISLAGHNAGQTVAVAGPHFSLQIIMSILSGVRRLCPSPKIVCRWRWRRGRTGAWTEPQTGSRWGANERYEQLGWVSHEYKLIFWWGVGGSMDHNRTSDLGDTRQSVGLHSNGGSTAIKIFGWIVHQLGRIFIDMYLIYMKLYISIKWYIYFYLPIYICVVVYLWLWEMVLQDYRVTCCCISVGVLGLVTLVRPIL